MKKVFFLVVIFTLSIFIGQIASAEMIIPSDVNSQCQCWCNCQPLSQEENDEEEELIDEQMIIEPGEVVISEFVSDPLTGSKEWVELYNRSSREIDLSTLFLLEGGGQKSKLSGVLPSNEYVVFNKSSLNNAGDLISVQTADGVVIDQVVYGNWNDGDLFDNAPKADDPYSVIRLNVNKDYDIDFQDFFVTLIPTPGLPNIYEPLEPEEIIEEEEETEIVENNEEALEDSELGGNQPADLLINEFLPNPSGADSGAEFIEIYNNGEAEINLKNWQLDDGEGGSSPFTVKDDLIILAGEYHAFYNDLTKIALNNDTDFVRLIDPSGLLIQTIKYENCVEGQSYNLVEDDWQWSNILTPGQENEISDLEIAGMSSVASASTTVALKSSKLPIKISLDKVRQYDNGQLVTVSGIVSVPPKLFAKNIIYLHGSGIQVYFSKAEWPEIKLGDRVELLGKLSESQGERRILLAQAEDLLVVEHDQEIIPHEITVEQIGEGVEGWLVKIKGEVVLKENGHLIFADETGEGKIYFKTGTELSAKNYSEGDKITLTGIVTQYKDEYRIIPRYQEDIVVEKVVVPLDENVLNVSQEQTVGALLINKIVIGGIIFLGIVFYLGKRFNWWEKSKNYYLSLLTAIKTKNSKS